MSMNKGMRENNEIDHSPKQRDELKNIIEAAIVVSDDPITIDRILGMFTDDTKPERAAVKDCLLALEQDYFNRGFELRCIDKGYRLQTREEYSPWLARLTVGRTPRYSRALLETLAIIAYRQPVTRGEIEEIRGVAVSTDIIRTLQEREWVRQVGVRDVPGKPALFGTTKGFLEYFSLGSLSQLPTLQDIRDMDTIAAELNMKLPLDDRAAGGGDIENSAETPDNDSEDNTEDNPQADMLDNQKAIDESVVENDSATGEDTGSTADPAEDDLSGKDGSSATGDTVEVENDREQTDMKSD